MTVLRAATANLTIPSGKKITFEIQVTGKFRSITTSSDQDVSFTTRLSEILAYTSDDSTLISENYSKTRMWGDIDFRAPAQDDYIELTSNPSFTIENNGTVDAHFTITFIKIVS